MSISYIGNKISYSPNGVSTAFAIPFPFTNNADIVVKSRISGVDTTYTLGVDYTITGGSGGTGTVTFTLAPIAGSYVIVMRVVPENQLTTYVANDSFPASAHELALDKLTEMVHQLQEQVARCIKIPDTDHVGVGVTLPIESTRANLSLKFDGSGNITAA